MIGSYDIHFNGGRPFMVGVNFHTNEVNIAKQDDEGYYDDFLTYYPENIFIGKSPYNSMTSFSGAYGSIHDGNSILLHIKDNEYIWIGYQIYSFTSLSKITEFYSPIGNNDVPYPYAIDENNNYYLLLHHKILLNISKEEMDEWEECPYDYALYNKNSSIKLDHTIIQKEL